MNIKWLLLSAKEMGEFSPMLAKEEGKVFGFLINEFIRRKLPAGNRIRSNYYILIINKKNLLEMKL